MATKPYISPGGFVFLDLQHDRAAQIALKHYFELTTSWPVTAERREPDLMGELPELQGVEKMFEDHQRYMKDWVLAASDGEYGHALTGDGALHFTMELINTSIHDVAHEILKSMPKIPGLWLYEGRLRYVGFGEEVDVEFDGDWRPATTVDLMYLQYSLHEAEQEVYDEGICDLQVVRRGIHKPTCSWVESQEEMPILDLMSAPCQCTEYAQPVPTPEIPS